MRKNLESTFSTRQYMLSKDYEIFYYNNSDVKDVGAHSHNYYEYYFFLEGDVTMHIGDKSYPMYPGDVMLIPPGIHHHATLENGSLKPYRRFVFWISKDYANELIGQSLDYGYLMQYVINHKEYIFHQDLVSANEISSRIFRLLTEVKSNRFGRDTQIQLDIQDVILFINRKVYEQKHQTSSHESDSLYEKLLLFIEEHIDEDLSLSRLSNEFYVSSYHVSHVFTENAGVSLHQYILKLRLRLCADAILTNDGIADVYSQFGFADYTSFYRAFKKEYGMSPRQYRNFNYTLED